MWLIVIPKKHPQRPFITLDLTSIHGDWYPFVSIGPKQAWHPTNMCIGVFLSKNTKSSDQAKISNHAQNLMISGWSCNQGAISPRGNNTRFLPRMLEYWFFLWKKMLCLGLLEVGSGRNLLGVTSLSNLLHCKQSHGHLREVKHSTDGQTQYLDANIHKCWPIP